MEYIVRTNLKSELVDSLFYNPHNRDLVIGFKKGEKYVYRNVPVETVIKFVGAKSPGTFFTKNVRTTFQYDKG